MNIVEKNNLVFLLHQQLLNTVEKFKKECPKGNYADIILGAGNCYIAGFLINAPSKEVALKTLDECCHIMRTMIESTPDSFFGDGPIKNFNLN